MKFLFNSTNDKKTSSVTNVGRVILPTEMSQHVQSMDMILYGTRISPINCGIISVNDRLTITFARTIEESDIIRHFFTYLAKNENIEVDIYSNEWGLSRNEV